MSLATVLLLASRSINGGALTVVQRLYIRDN